MENKVIVLTPKGRRVNVRVTPNTTLLQILEDVCQRHGFNSDEYCLKHYNKDVPLTQMFRFSGLPNNCLLEMIQSERKRVTSSVDICIQLEDGTRRQATFKPEDSVWHVVTQLNDKELQSYDSPVVIYTRQEMFGKAVMSQTTLKSLGILEGKALMRLLNKKPEDLKSQANVYKPSVMKEDEKKGNEKQRSTFNSNSKTISGSFALTKNLVENLKKQDKEETQDVAKESSDSKKGTALQRVGNNWDFGVGRSLKPSTAEQNETNKENGDQEEPEPQYNIIGERNAIVYSLDAVHTKIEHLPDSFYDLTVNDLKLILRDLKNIAAGNEDAPLLTEKLRDFRNNETMLHKISQYKICIIRIQFPDRYVLQGMFKPIDKINNVLEFVKKFLNKPDVPFYLFTIPPKRILEVDITLLALDLVPNALVHFSYKDNNNAKDGEIYLKAKFLEKLTTPEAAIFAANKFRGSQQRKLRTEITIQQDNDDEDNRPGPSTGAIPKRPRSNGAGNKT